MNNKFYIIIAITISTISNGLYSQNQPQPYAISVGGLLLEHQYSHEQVIAALGSPQSYHTENDFTFGNIREYIFNSNNVHFYNNLFKYLNLINSAFKLNGIVGVGDPASKIYDLPHNNIENSNMNNSQIKYIIYTLGILR